MRTQLDGGDRDPVRLAPLSPRAWPAQMRAALAPLVPPVPRAADSPKGMNLLGTLAHHPALVETFHGLIGHLLYASTLTPRQRELAVLRVAARRGAVYEWAQHVSAAQDAGLTLAEVAAVADPDVSGWSAVEAALLRGVDELLEDARVSDDAYAVLSAALDERQLFDLVATVGTYETLAMMLRTFGVPLDDDLAPWASRPFG